MRLYYIGNGFDLKHRMKTSYLDFKSYLKENERNLYYLNYKIKCVEK